MTRRLRILVVAAVGVALARRVAARVASLLGHRLPPGPPPLESERPPGWMPRRRDP